MELFDFLAACIPILSFGLIPVIAAKIGGRPVEQSMGVALGGLIFSLLLFAIRRPELNLHIFVVSALSGLFWAIGSVGQFVSIKYLGVSKAMPISNGAQIIGTSLLGVMLGDWATPASRAYGFSALVLIIVGIVFTSYKQACAGEKIQWCKGVAINLLSALGFTFYVGVLKYYNIDGWSGILPQSLGQIAGITLIALAFFKTLPFSKITYKNSITGIVWGIGNIALLLSQVKIGLAVAYPISQAAVIVSILGGVFINGEKKSPREWTAAIIGMAVIAAGLLLIYLSALNDTATVV